MGIAFDRPAKLWIGPDFEKNEGYGHPDVRHFESAAEAVRFAVEQLTTPIQSGTKLELEDGSYLGMEQIRAAYGDPTFPRPRK